MRSKLPFDVIAKELRPLLFSDVTSRDAEY
jgi:hypothetical protein